jgi:hypothetical protein
VARRVILTILRKEGICVYLDDRSFWPDLR